MRLSVSSLTCPEWTLERMTEEVVKHGIPAVDLRTLEGRRDLWNLPEFTPGAREATKCRLRDAGISVAGVSTSVRAGSGARIGDASPDGAASDGTAAPTWRPEPTWRTEPQWRTELAAALELCRDVGGRYLRIFAGPTNVGAVTEETLQAIAADYRAMCRIAEPYDLLVLLETHDVVSSGAVVRDIVRRVDHPLAGIVWDVRHPLHLAGETYEQTGAAVAELLRLVHVKDFDGPSFDHVQFGTGAVDPPHLVEVLRSIGYAGDIVLEQPRVAATGRPMPEENIAGFAAAFSDLPA